MRGLGSQTCWEVVVLAAWMLRCFVIVEMRKQVAPGTYSLHYEVFDCFSLSRTKVVSCLFWVVERELVLSSLILSTFQMAKPWMKWF